MNRRSFISKIVQGGTVVATGLPEKLLSSEASTVDETSFEIRMPKYVTGVDLPRLRLIVYDDRDYVYVGKPVSPEEEWTLRTRSEFHYKKNLDDPFVHNKYFLVALLKDTETKKI